jgi:hypothetical protein
MEAFAALLHQRAELALFLAIVLGHIIGRFHWKGIGFGSVVGTLESALAVNSFRRELPRHSSERHRFQ